MLGKLTTANNIEPDLRIEQENLSDDEPTTQSSDSSDSDDDSEVKQHSDQRYEKEKPERPQRLAKLRDFLLPGTISRKE